MAVRQGRVHFGGTDAFCGSRLCTNNLFKAASSGRPASLIELYSSEGCSSCPPADEWLTKLKGDSHLWKDFVPVSFHVDYWDYLGWTDKWAKPEFTSRQRNYSHEWGTRSVYTPGFVLDGREWTSWGRVPATSPSGNPGALTVVESEPGKFTVTFASGDNPAASLKAHFAVLGFDISSKVSAGENSGRTLLHDFVVLNHQVRSMAGGKLMFEASYPSKSSVPRAGLAVWVTPKDSETPLQSTGGWWAR